MEKVDLKAIQLVFDMAEQFQPVTELMAKYEDIPMSLADACLVRMSELLPGALIFTTDSDFGIYRRLRRQPIQTLAP
jgi:predicted nucleic acid-binding protein